jgi:hypothetical protein
MKTSDLPEEIYDPIDGDDPNEADETIIDHSEVNNPAGDVIKKLINRFKGGSSSSEKGKDRFEIGRGVAKVNRDPDQANPSLDSFSGKNSNPDKRLRAFMMPAASTPAETQPEITAIPGKSERKIRLRPNREMTRRAFWDVAAIFSLIFNAILIGALFIMYGQIKNLRTMMNGLLGGLYSNFVDMDNASIDTTIAVEAQVPVVFSLPIQQSTTVSLTSAVPINGTTVNINSGGLSLNAPATVTLPEGTNLPIALNMDVPVQVIIPISLQVPVKIPMNQTNLHTPFTGLQQTIRPLYCTINKNAQYPQGVYICSEHTDADTGNP